ncbi:hypothetical protein SETIT_8G141400v2 [Setaria italica]|uniref:Uncharacterized protein n=1 Tax=Setaria italica TaxID=4555 RepID=A0A368S7P1_SETIT|nr:hypothetical protein SETIT_8G141400v2 [Setaria italica]
MIRRPHHILTVCAPPAGRASATAVRHPQAADRSPPARRVPCAARCSCAAHPPPACPGHRCFPSTRGLAFRVVGPPRWGTLVRPSRHRTAAGRRPSPPLPALQRRRPSELGVSSPPSWPVTAASRRHARARCPSRPCAAAPPGRAGKLPARPEQRRK